MFSKNHDFVWGYISNQDQGFIKAFFNLFLAFGFGASLCAFMKMTLFIVIPFTLLTLIFLAFTLVAYFLFYDNSKKAFLKWHEEENKIKFILPFNMK